MAPTSLPSYVERTPVDPLAHLVSAVWIQHVARDGGPYEHRHIPNGAVELRWAVGSSPLVVGPLTEPVVEELAAGTTVVGMRFHPGVAEAALGLPASELVDEAADLEDIWGRVAVALGERLDAAGSPEKALDVLQAHLVSRLPDATAPDSVVSEAVRLLMPWHRTHVTSLSPRLYISEAQLRRRFRTAVGFAPKVLQRLLRFQGFLAIVQHAIAQGTEATDEGLAALAIEVGYADQPHLNRECVRLTAVPPATFVGQTQKTCACGHDHAASFTPMLRARATVSEDAIPRLARPAINGPSAAAASAPATARAA